MERRSTITPRDLECMLCDETAEPKALPLSLLEEITDGFSEEQQIGRGGFAVVYKGKLENRTVAVKRMSTYMHEKEFQQEVECLMMVKHKNIVRFLGYCADRQGSMERYNGKFVMADVHQRLLCFEYLPRGSLHEYITDTSRRLQWTERYQIITGICQGLHYLHQKDIVHLDLKPTNILLDDNLVPKIADFGLSRCFSEMQSRVITMIAGTFGYMAPEFCDHTEITYRHSYRLDIYSLGVIIIEILTGKRGYHPVHKVVESWSNMLGKSQSDVQLEQVRVCAEIGLECTDFNPAKRPDTQHIISRLDETESMDGYIKTDVITSQQAEDAPNELHQYTPNVPGETSSEENATALDFVLSAISKRNLMKKIEKVESTVSEVKYSPLLGVASKSTLNDIGNKNGSQIRPVGRVIVEKLHRSPIAAETMVGWLGTKDISFGKNNASLVMLNDTMDTLWWRYQQLNPDIRRCFKYCSIFPRRSKLRRVELVCMWIAQGFVKTNCATEDMEDVAEGYIQELVSCSFLQPEGTSSDTDCFRIHDLLHDLLDKVAGNCFRIENARGQRGEGWAGEVPHYVQHLFVQNYDGELITKILGLEHLRTLIIYVVERDTPVEEKVIESICKRLLKLRVLAIAFSQEHDPIKQHKRFLVPESISQLKHLCYLAFRTSYSCTVILPSTLTELHHIQLLDFGNGQILEFTLDDLINLRHMFCWSHVKFRNIGSLVSLQTLPGFTIRNEQGFEIKQLRNLNKLRGRLRINGLENVKSKEEALEANLAAKERLTKLALQWGDDDDTRCSPEVEAEVLAGLRPPLGLQTLHIWSYEGSRYPDWMVGKQNGGPKDLQQLYLWGWSQPGPGPELEAFPHLRVLWLVHCSWDSLPHNMEHLTSLKELVIFDCFSIRSLPTLPQSLEEFHLDSCNDEFMKSCQTVGHPHWQKTEHIPNKTFRPRR